MQNGLSYSSSPTRTHQHVCIATVPWAYKSTGNTVTHQMSRKVIKRCGMGQIPIARGGGGGGGGGEI